MSAQGFQPTLDYQTVIQTFWASILAQVQAGLETYVLPDNVPPPMVETIRDLLSKKLAKDIIVEHLENRKVFSLKSSSKMEKKEKIPRPANAFILYRKANHDAVKAESPGIGNNDISKKVAVMWKKESPEVRKLWKAKAEEVKAEHAKKHPGYTYQPRKSGELKRRMTKRRLAEMMALNEEIEGTIDYESSATPDTASIDESSSPPNFGHLNGNPILSTYLPVNIFSAPPAIPVTAVPNDSLMQNALQHADEFFPFEDPDSANDLAIDYNDANYNRKFDLPVNDAQLGRFATDLSAYNQVFGNYMPSAGDTAVIESSFSQSVFNEQDADLNFLSAWLNLEEADNGNVNGNSYPGSGAVQPGTAVDVAVTSQSIISPVTLANAEMMHDFSVPTRLNQSELAAHKILDSQRMAAFRLRRERLDSESRSVS